MIRKKIILLAILLVSFLAISAVCAAENATDDIASTDDEIPIADDALGDIASDEELNSSDALSLESEQTLSQVDESDQLAASPPYNKYSASVSDTTIISGSKGNIIISVSPCSGYSYAYDFYLKIYDSNNKEKISKNYYSTSSTTKITHTISANQLSIGTYTIKLINYADSKVMDTATLYVKSSSGSYTYPSSSAYSVSVSDTTMTAGSSGSISMSISPASSSYKYRYYYYLKVYNSNGVEKLSTSYYGTSAAYSKSYSVGSNTLSAGTYTIKVINYADNIVMDTATLTVKSYNYPPASAYSVSVSDTTMTAGSSGSISMSISPASSIYNYKYYYYLKVYDSNGAEKISISYCGTSAAYSKTYTVSSNKLDFGTYVVKIINYEDNQVMGTAKLTVNKITIESSNLYVDYADNIQYKVRVSENYNYRSGLNVVFTCNNQQYSATTDSNGYATLNIHLNGGQYQVTTKCSSVNAKNTIEVSPILISNNYANPTVQSATAYFGQNKKITYGFDGYMMGYFKVYRGSSAVYTKKLDTSGYVDDYQAYDGHSYSFNTNVLKSPGTYRAKLIDKSGKVIAQSTVKITKAKTHIKCSSFLLKVGSKKTIKAYIYDKSNSRKNIAGTAKFRINGKTYTVKVKNGYAVVKNVKFPQKVKTYKCSVKYLGNKNYYKSSAKFKISVRKLTSYVDVYANNAKVGAKTTINAYVAIKTLGGDYVWAKGGTVKITVAGSTYKAKVKNGVAKVTVRAPYTAKTYKVKAVYMGSKSIKKSSDTCNLIVKKPASKYKIITTTAKSYWITKRSGSFKVETIIFDMTAGFMAPYKYVDTFLYKNGKLVSNSKYSVKYQIDGRWSGWTKYIQGTSHHRHAVYDGSYVGKIQVKFKKNVNSYVGY